MTRATLSGRWLACTLVVSLVFFTAVCGTSNGASISRLLNARGAPTTCWSRDGRTLFFFVDDNPSSMTAGVYESDVKSGRSRIIIASGELRRALHYQSGERVEGIHLQVSDNPPRLLLQHGRNIAVRYLNTGVMTELELDVPDDSADVRLSPTLHWVTFVKNNTLWLGSVGQGKPAAPIQPATNGVLTGQLDSFYSDGFSTYAGYAWSSDESYLTFVKLDETQVDSVGIIDSTDSPSGIRFIKYPKYHRPTPTVTIGVYALATMEVKWVPLTKPDSYIPRFGWVNDTNTLWVTALNHDQNELTLFTYNPASNVRQVMFKEVAYDWLKIRAIPWFSRTGNGVFWQSDRDGYSHVYFYPRAGSAAVQITKGQWNVERFVGVSNNEEFVYVLASLRTPSENDFFKVSVVGANMERLTSIQGTHNVDLSPNSESYTDAVSTLSHPSALYCGATITPGESLLQGPALHAEYLVQPAFRLVPMGRERRPVPAFLFTPQQLRTSHRRLPAIIAVYGAPGGQIVRNEWSITNLLFYQSWVRAGYIVLVIDNRLGRRFSHQHQTAVRGQPGQIELEDLDSAIRFLQRTPTVDATRIGIWGASYGGFVALYAASHGVPIFRSAAAISPVTDWGSYDELYSERLLGEHAPERTTLAINGADVSVPVFIVHGLDDDNVLATQSIELIRQLIDHNKRCDFFLYPGLGHGTGGWDVWQRISVQLLHFWRTTLLLSNTTKVR